MASTPITSDMRTPTRRGGTGSIPSWRKNRDRLDGMSLSIEMAGSVVLGWYLGKLFDDHFLTAPWGMAFFLLAGVIAATRAVLRFYRQAKKVMAQKEPGVVVAEAMDADKAAAAHATHGGGT